MQRVQFTLGRCRGKELCVETGMTQQDIVTITGYTKQEISDWFTNKRDMSVPVLYTIAKAFNRSMEEVYVFIPQEPPEKRVRQKRKG